ncbi:MAG: DUF2806 domain-containing protein [Paracoccaceae bacterium]
MDGKVNITLAGDLSKPATVLIEKISEAVGGAVRPWQTKRVATAEGRAKIILAEAEAKSRQILESMEEIDPDLANRAIQRMVASEINKQLNIENITRIAIEKLSPNSAPDRIERDFLSNLFEKAANVSNQEMQSLWGSILAGEANSPGKFSKRTIELASHLERRDAELFTRFSSCCAMFGSKLVALTTKTVANIMEQGGINFDRLTHLDSLGLITHNSLGGFRQKFTSANFPTTLLVHYFGIPVSLVFNAPPGEVAVGSVLLTEAGAQLAEICGAECNLSLLDAFILDTVSDNISISSPWPRRGAS